jgi:hypothetical protein
MTLNPYGAEPVQYASDDQSEGSVDSECDEAEELDDTGAHLRTGVRDHGPNMPYDLHPIIWRYVFENARADRYRARAALPLPRLHRAGRPAGAVAGAQ